jgi:hypothetical protein
MRPSAFIGNSTAFGVGATHDRTAIASQLNQVSNATFFSFAGRTINPLQELLAFLLFARTRVDVVLIMSGINLLDMSYRFATEAHRDLPPFHVERLFFGRLALGGEPTLASWFQQQWRRLRGRSNADPFVRTDLVDQLARGLSDLERLAADDANPERALDHFGHVMDLWRALCPARAGRVVFALQPVPDWFGRPLAAREAESMQASEAHRPEAWRRVRAALAGRAEAFRAGLLEALRARDIAAVDLNRDPRLLAVDRVFIDRYHLTDAAQAAVARTLADALETSAR